MILEKFCGGSEKCREPTRPPAKNLYSPGRLLSQASSLPTLLPSPPRAPLCHSRSLVSLLHLPTSQTACRSWASNSGRRPRRRASGRYDSSVQHIRLLHLLLLLIPPSERLSATLTRQQYASQGLAVLQVLRQDAGGTRQDAAPAGSVEAQAPRFDASAQPGPPPVDICRRG